MSELKKEYKTKLKTFQYLGIMILVATAAFVLSNIDLSDAESKSKVLSMGALMAFSGGFMLYFGMKERKLQIYDDKIEYHTSKLAFDTTFDDLAMVKSFQEQGKSSYNLILMKENDEILSISTAFFPQEYLVSAFNDLLKTDPEYNITFEDDLGWKKE